MIWGRGGAGRRRRRVLRWLPDAQHAPGHPAAPLRAAAPFWPVSRPPPGPPLAPLHSLPAHTPCPSALSAPHRAPLPSLPLPYPLPRPWHCLPSASPLPRPHQRCGDAEKEGQGEEDDARHRLPRIVHRLALPMPGGEGGVGAEGGRLREEETTPCAAAGHGLWGGNGSVPLPTRGGIVVACTLVRLRSADGGQAGAPLGHAWPGRARCWLLLWEAPHKHTPPRPHQLQIERCAACRAWCGARCHPGHLVIKSDLAQPQLAAPRVEHQPARAWA